MRVLLHPPTYPLLPHHPSIPLHWGIKPLQGQGPPLSLMPGKAPSGPLVLPLTPPLGACAQSHGWLRASEHPYLYWSGSGRASQETADQAPVSKHFLASAIVSGFGVCMWNRFPGGSVSGWPFFQSLLHTSFLYIRFRGSVHYHQGSRTWQHPGRQDELRVLHLVPKANRRLTSRQLG